jgi:glucosamine--fructose-6-phosphate aminotransferase (isomerizing)
MCGIVGYLGNQQAQSILLDCLGRLEYRGYDSAGMATIAEGKLGRQRCTGKSAALQSLLVRNPLPGEIGIAHTRWATHGRPTDNNSHPHTDCSGTLAIVHNGIIENYSELKEQLERDGHRFVSQTDSEVIAHLIESKLALTIEGDLKAAVLVALALVQGTYALAVISQQHPDKIVVARSGGPPLVIGHAADGIYISSDITAILHYTRDIQILEDSEIAEIRRDGASIMLLDGTPVDRARIQIAWNQDAADRSGFPHFMLKEIHEQPQAVLDTIRGQNLLAGGAVSFPQALYTTTNEFRLTRKVTILACGSSWHAGLVGKHLIESISGTPVDVDIASEYRYRAQFTNGGTLAIGISQSGETADTLGALKTARNSGAGTLAICNVNGSSMSREADGVIYTHAGPEIGVASTKTFTCQLTALVLFAISLGLANGNLSARAAETLMQDLLHLPLLIQRILAQNEILVGLARLFDNATSALYLGRGVLFPLAVEGALKLKEISYIHAEAYPAGELKHGPIALIDRNIPVVVIATQGPLYEKLLTAIQEVKARDGSMIVMATEGDSKIGSIVENVFYLPSTTELLMPILMALPLQLLAYHIAARRGCEIDQPRNLAKSVTVD